MRRVVVTGMGIWSCIGTSLEEVTNSLHLGRSGIIADPARLEYGLKSALVGNVPTPDLKPYLPRKFRVTMSQDAEYAYMAARQAFEQAGVTDDYLHHNEVGTIFGCDGSCKHLLEANVIMQEEHNSMMVGPNALFKGETSSSIMNLNTVFHLRGVSMVVGAACSSGSHAIGLGTLYIRSGLQDMILVGGTCETDKEFSVVTDALGALSLRNDAPQQASRPFDKNRDGMIPSGGAAALVLEDYDHAVARGATILAEVVGYGFSSNGTEDISVPDSEGEYVAMSRALKDAGVTADDIDYVNAHATSTPAGDMAEAEALTRLFKGKHAWISSTKSMTGHENWMAGASEAVYSILMMQHGFVAPNVNLEEVDDSAKDLRLAKECIDTPLHLVLSNSSGMGGTNSVLVIRKL